MSNYGYTQPVGVASDPGFYDEKAPEDHEHGLFTFKQNLVLQNVWTDYNILNPLRIKKAADFCVIEGAVKATAGGARAQTIALLPPECLPFKVFYYAVDVGGTWYYLDFNAGSASIVCNIPNTLAVPRISLHGLFFRTA